MNFFGYDMNGTLIEESTVDELYRIAENEILSNSELSNYCDSVSIDKDSFEYFQTGTAFGAAISYDIYADITSGLLDKNSVNIYSMFNKNSNGTFKTSTLYFNENNTFSISCKIVVKRNNVKDVVIEDISVFENGTYSEYETENLKTNLNFSKFKEFVSDLATLVVRDVHSQLSNI